MERHKKNLEKVLPADLFIHSGIKNVFERTQQMYKKEMNSLAMDSINYKKNDIHVSQYNSIITNYQGGGIHSLIC